MAISSLMLACFVAAGLGWWIVQAKIPEKIGGQIGSELDHWVRNAGLEVEEVLAVGRSRTKSSIIRDKVEKIYGQNILLVDIEGIKSDLESLPWIRSVAVRRFLPNTVKLELEEHRPIAIWRDEFGETRLIDERGELILSNDLNGFTNLPIISGRGAKDEVVGLFRRLIEQPQLIGRVSGAELVDERRWNVFLGWAN